MALLDVLEKKDIEELRLQLETLLASFEFSIEIELCEGCIMLRLVTRPRSAEERREILSKLQAARTSAAPLGH